MNDSQNLGIVKDSSISLESGRSTPRDDHNFDRHGHRVSIGSERIQFVFGQSDDVDIWQRSVDMIYDMSARQQFARFSMLTEIHHISTLSRRCDKIGLWYLLEFLR